MNSIKTVADVQNAETKALVEFYNHHNTDKPVKKFADRATAVKRCEALAAKLFEGAEVQETPEAEEDPTKPAAGSGWGNLFNAQQNDDADPNSEEEEESKTVSAPSMFGTLLNGPTEAQKEITKAHSANATKVVDGKKVDPNAKVEEKEVAGRASNSAGVAASWTRPEVFAARLKRDGVSVTLDGETTEHNSTRLAFRAYRLPQSKHIRFRMKLKAAGEATFNWNGKDYLFKIVQIDAGSAE